MESPTLDKSNESKQILEEEDNDICFFAGVPETP
jgi:hypothetical protein